MQQEIIKLENHIIGEDVISSVSARDLHIYLGSKQDFSSWIKKRVTDYGFVENVDFIRLDKKMEANNATKIEYYISLNMAKEISMVERNENGRLARKYFISCEEKLKAEQKRLSELSELDLARNYVKVLEEREELKKQAKLDKPKVEAFDGAKLIFPKKESVFDKERGFKKDINELYPFLRNDKITNILEYYTTKKYKDTNYYIKEEIEECVEMFLDECYRERSDSKKSVILFHDCFLGGKTVVNKDLAIKYLGYTEEFFE
jgi:phage anti-repressor protein